MRWSQPLETSPDFVFVTRRGILHPFQHPQDLGGGNDRQN